MILRTLFSNSLLFISRLTKALCRGRVRVRIEGLITHAISLASEQHRLSPLKYFFGIPRCTSAQKIGPEELGFFE